MRSGEAGLTRASDQAVFPNTTEAPWTAEVIEATSLVSPLTNSTPAAARAIAEGEFGFLVTPLTCQFGSERNVLATEAP